MMTSYRELLLTCKQRDPKFDHSWGHRIVALVVLNTKKDAIHSNSNFASTSVQRTLRPPLQRAEQSGQE